MTKPKKIRPTSAECSLIRKRTLSALGLKPHNLKMEPGRRYNTKDQQVETHINIARVTHAEPLSPEWFGFGDDTDLSDHATWMDFRNGFDPSPDGYAIIDFYCYYIIPFDEYGCDLIDNVTAYFDREGLFRLESGRVLWERGQ
jgi:hypothetical protein